MKIQRNGLLPLRKANCERATGCSTAGETRADENAALHVLHVIWVREHNRIARKLKILNPHWREYQLFQTTRKIVGAMLQHITYNEFLPFLINLGPHKGYSSHVDPSVSNGFSTSAFRFGHSLVPNSWALLNKNFDKTAPDLPIRETFRNITFVRKFGIESLTFGLLGNQSQEVDQKFSFNIVRRLFVPPSQSDYRDLTALNMQRARDHGVPTYGHWRKVCGLKTIRSYYDLYGIIHSAAIPKLKSLYKNPNDIDLFAAGISEIPLPGKRLGETFHCIIKDQFKRLRTGDRFFYQHHGVFTSRQLHEIKKVTLSKVLCDNLHGVVSLQKEAFKAFNGGARRYVCGSIPGINLHYWKQRPY